MNACPTRFAMLLCKTVVDSTKKYGVRSSTRTDEIHNLVSAWITIRNPRLRCVTEERLRIETGSIDVDIVVHAASTGDIVACVSFKGLMNNVGQNVTNNENVKCGEAIKITSAIPPTAKLVFLDVVPSKCPYYTQDGTLKKMETVQIETWKLREKSLMSMANRRCELISDIFTVFPNYVWNSRTDMYCEDITDSDDLVRMAEFIDGLAPL